MKWLIPFIVFLIVPSKAAAFLSQGYPVIYTHELGRIFFLIACIFILFAIVRHRLYREQCWRYIVAAVITFMVWDVDVGLSHFAELLIVGDTDGWNYLRQVVVVEGKYYLSYIGRFDYVLLDLAMFFFYLALRNFLEKEEESKAPSSAMVLLPFLPIIICDVAGAVVMIALTLSCLNVSLKLYRRSRENALWHYMVWLSSSYVMYSVSRAVGHIAKPLLVSTGNPHIWRYMEPISASIDNFAFFLVGSVTLFFIGIYNLYLKMFRDEREIETINAELTEMNQELETLVAERTMAMMGLTVADQVRNPSAIIGCICKRVLAKEDLTPEMQDKLKEIIEECRRLESVVENFEYLLRSRQSIFKYEDINQVIRSVVSFVGKESSNKGLRLDINLSSQPLKMNLEKNLLRAALFHVMRNAIDATSEGEKISVTSAGDSNTISVIISDTGSGIPKEIREKVFDPFFTTKLHKFGMGLPLVKQIVSEHLGEVMLESEEGKGTTVTITFPVRWKENQEISKYPLPASQTPRSIS
jgi:signal transduction histidine kinase